MWPLAINGSCCAAKVAALKVQAGRDRAGLHQHLGNTG